MLSTCILPGCLWSRPMAETKMKTEHLTLWPALAARSVLKPGSDRRLVMSMGDCRAEGLLLAPDPCRPLPIAAAAAGRAMREVGNDMRGRHSYRSIQDTQW
jgi:hypothetical protein